MSIVKGAEMWVVSKISNLRVRAVDGKVYTNKVLAEEAAARYNQDLFMGEFITEELELVESEV